MPWDRGMNLSGYLPTADNLTQTVNRQVVLVMLLLCYHIWFQIDFPCPCTSNRNYLHCYSYMVLPCFIIICIILWNDMRVGRFLRYSCNFISLERKRSQRKFCFQFLICVLQAATSGFLWCGSVLIDGDWYVCCGAVYTGEVRKSMCAEKELSQSKTNQRIHLKNQSMVSKTASFHLQQLIKCQNDESRVFLAGFRFNLHSLDCRLLLFLGAAMEQMVLKKELLQGDV